MISQLHGKRITVMGLGRFGGGTGVTRWLAAQGGRVLVTDMQPADKLADSLEDLADLARCGAVSLRLGGHDMRDFQQCDLLVANPAVPKPWQNSFIRAALDAGAAVTTEIELLTQRLNRHRVIGVTGSAGKSTTAAMIHHLLQRTLTGGQQAHLGGNIGGSLLNHLPSIHPHDWIVLELSSAMLYWLGDESPACPRLSANDRAVPRGWSPHVAVLTNIAPNHIDWHGSFEHYRQSKLNIFRFQSQEDLRVGADDLPRDLPHVQLKIPGRHNQANAHMAIAAVNRATGVACHDLLPLLEDFTGLPHRLQLIAEHDGLRFYNDSKSTTPQATVLAVEAFDDPARVHLIAGGYDKGSDLTPIARLTERIAGLYTIGATGAGLARAATACCSGFALCALTLEAAVAAALDRMTTGDVLLLSPGCASWDQFTNYEQRGERFAKVIGETLGCGVGACGLGLGA